MLCSLRQGHLQTVDANYAGYDDDKRRENFKFYFFHITYHRRQKRP
jgi:hypothetical protein